MADDDDLPVGILMLEVEQGDVTWVIRAEDITSIFIRNNNYAGNDITVFIANGDPDGVEVPKRYKELLISAMTSSRGSR